MYSYLYSFDVFIYQLINLSYHNIFLDNLALLICYFGVTFVGILIAIFLMIFGDKRSKKISIILLISIFLTYCVTGLIKYVVLRPRPFTQLTDYVLLTTVTDPSFPSGHTSNATTVFYILSREYKRYWLMIIPILVGLSRIYVGVHYPSDVLCGFIVGFLIAYVVDYIFHKKFMGEFWNLVEKL